MWGEDATRFLARVLPWPASLEDAGYCNLHWVNEPNEKGRKPWWNGRAFRDVGAMVSFTGWLLTKPNIRDIYFCTSLQAKTAINKKGKEVALRSQVNTLASKILFLDIDAKDPPKGYADASEAFAALQQFVKTSGVAFPSAVIHSGGGLHAYWITDEPLTPGEWQMQAEKLRAAGMQHGLRFDSNVMEISRILRIPETFNHKTTPPKPVTLLYLE